MGETAARFLPWPSGKDSKGNRPGRGLAGEAAWEKKTVGAKRNRSAGSCGTIPTADIPIVCRTDGKWIFGGQDGKGYVRSL